MDIYKKIKKNMCYCNSNLKHLPQGCSGAKHRFQSIVDLHGKMRDWQSIYLPLDMRTSRANRLIIDESLLWNQIIIKIYL